MAIDKIILQATDSLFTNTEIDGTEAARMPVGTTAQRTNPKVGDLRHNTDLDQLEQYTTDGWKGISAPPSVTSIDISNIDTTSDPQTIVITGQNFDGSATATLLDNTGVTLTATSSTRNSSSQITLVYGGSELSAIDVDTPEPLVVKVTNGSGLVATLEGSLGVDDNPVWSSPAAGSNNEVIEDESATINLSATDPETGGSITYSLGSGTLPTGMTVSGSTITGTPTGGTYNASGVSVPVTITATGADGETTNRSFNIIRKWRDGSTSALAASTADAIKQLTGTTTSTDYWINCNGTPRQIFCDMDGTYVGGNSRNDSSKGYMLLHAFGNNNATLNNALAHTTTTSYTISGSSAGDLTSFGLTTNSTEIGTNADNMSFYVGSAPIGYLAQTAAQFNADVVGFTINRINIKVGHPYSDGGVRTYINGVTQSPDLSSVNGDFTYEADRGSYTWAWYVEEASATPSISSIYHIFVR